jgi:ABC-type polysaccharide/polyol phosphate transport system ATPase subunit
MDSRVGIELTDLGLRFRKYPSRNQTLKHSLMSVLRGRSRPAREDFWLYRHLSLTIHDGQAVGVIGSNGAGKTTLLKLLAGILRPNEGRIEVRGRVAPLIELSAGMNPELSAAENIVLAGVFMGRGPRAMRGRVEPVLDFAGLSEYAEMPLKYYSNGMRRRLAFSIATDIEPEVFLIDEIFSGGDKDFVEKGSERMKSLIRSAHIVVMVSHALPLIRRITSRTIWIDRGRIVDDGPTREVVDRYVASAPPQHPAKPNRAVI